jgi:hypothetical protein
MRIFRSLGAAVLAVAVAAPMAALAAAPDNLDDATPALQPPAGVIAPLEYQLNTQMVVRDWVLCVSQAYAESLAKARAAGLDKALATYSDLKASKSCGQFTELTVVLHQSLFAAAAGDNAQVFSAAVSIAGRWANAFLVEGGLPAEH